MRPAGHIVGTTDGDVAVRKVKARANQVKRVIDFGTIGRAVAGIFPEKRLEELEEKGYVRYIEEEGRMWAIDSNEDSPPWTGDEGGPGGQEGPPSWAGNGKSNQGGGESTAGETLPWGVDRIDAEVAHSNGVIGQNARIAILDTGIDSDHPDLQSNIPQNRSDHFVAKGAECRGSKSQCRFPWDDDNGHGTHVAGTTAAIANNGRGVIGVAPKATLHSVKVLDKSGSGSWSAIAKGITWVGDRLANGNWSNAVANMSLGGSSGSQTIQDACNYAYQNGVLLVAAAGNNGPCENCVSFPARYRSVIAVSATNKQNSLANFSSTGLQVELAAPGTAIPSTYVGGGYRELSGTSMASPHIAGTGALLLAHTGMPNATNITFSDGNLTLEAYENPGGVRQTLRDTADDLGPAGVDEKFGYGIVDAAHAVTGIETPLASR